MKQQVITTQRIERALHTAARVVAEHGDAYLPIFQRLERELADARARDDVRRRAIEMANHGLKGDKL